MPLGTKKVPQKDAWIYLEKGTPEQHYYGGFYAPKSVDAHLCTLSNISFAQKCHWNIKKSHKRPHEFISKMGGI